MADIKAAKIDPRLEANIHPVTKVYCDDGAFVCYERDGASPIVVDAASPLHSRRAAFRRMLALLRGAKREAQVSGSEVVFMLPISQTGRGLTYIQLQQQTEEAIASSIELEQKIKLNIRKKFKTGL